jgi:integrase
VTANDWSVLKAEPPKIKKLKCPPATTDYLLPEESELLLSKADGILYEMLLTTLRTGIRQSELKGLQWEAINWKTRTLTVTHSWNEDIKMLEAPKSNRTRVIPLDNEVYEILFKRKEKAGFVFLNPDGEPFRGKPLNHRLAVLCEEVGLRIVTWHKLRHTFATHLTTAGAAPYTVQRLLGHSSIVTTMRYAQVPDSSMREAVDLLGSKNFGQPAVNRQI